MEFGLLKDIVLLLGLALLTLIMFRKLKIPSIIGFLVTGIIAGPHALGFVNNTHEVEQMAEIGVVLLLFTIGIEFSLKELLRIRQLVLWGGGLQVLLTIGIITLIGILAGFTPQQSVFFGFLVSLSSTAILMKLLMDSGEMDTPHGKAALGILIFQDLCIVPLMLFVPFLGGAGNGIADVVLISVKAVAVVVIAHFGARFGVPWIFSQVVRIRSRELFILTIIFIGFGTAWLTAQAGLSLALGAFIAGLAISESEYSHQVMGDIIPFRDAFISLFFISVGMLLDPVSVLSNPLNIIAIISTIIVVKFLVSVMAILLLKFPSRVAVTSGLILAQVGEFSLSRIMQNISQRYTQWFNWRYNRSGHVFQGRFKAVMVDADEYLLELAAYIHLNPVRACMTDQPGSYPWSSHRAYLGKETLPWLQTDFILSQFSPSKSQARAKFAAFVEDRIKDGRRDEFHGEKTADSRIFGDDKFVDLVLIAAEALPEKRPGISEVVTAVKKMYGISDEQLMSKGRERSICEARGLAAWATLEISRGKLVELARLLHRNSSTLTCAVRNIEKLREQDPSVAEKTERLRQELQKSSYQGLTPE